MTFDCVICVEPVSDTGRTTHCLNGCLQPIGHKVCSDIWFKNHSTCPLCRTEQNEEERLLHLELVEAFNTFDDYINQMDAFI